MHFYVTLDLKKKTFGRLESIMRKSMLYLNSFNIVNILAGAPALWAASAAGHYDVVRYLVEEGGADINQTTDSSSSPLRGACYDGHFKIGLFDY